jgi:hypothetical protein
METPEALVAQLHSSIKSYRNAIASRPNEEKEDLLRVAGQADAVARALEAKDVANVKLSLYAASRQASDSYFSLPPEFRELDQSLQAVKKYIFARN